MEMLDQDWREYNIHGDDVEDQYFDLFATSTDKFQTLEWNFPNLKTISLRGNAEDYTNSTGMTVWAGAEVMCDYLLTHPGKVKDKNVLELGAGLGLCGVLAHELGASTVRLTDGDTEVLENLRYNVKDSALVDPSSTTSSISCPQLIWGKNLDAFARSYGKQDIVISTDCGYMTKCLVPMFETVHKLLDPENGLFLFVNISSSQSPLEKVLERAHQCGLELCPNTKSEKNDQVHIFRHK